MCVDPATALAITSITSTALTAGEGVAAYMQGKANEKSFKNAARQELMNTAVEESAVRKEGRKFAARQRIQALASGGDVASGSLDAIAIADTQQLELNALMRRYAGETKAENLRFQGRSAARVGAITASGNFMQAGVEAIGAGSRVDWGVFGQTADAVTTKKSLHSSPQMNSFF